MMKWDRQVGFLDRLKLAHNSFAGYADWFNEVVYAASNAATLAAIRALQEGSYLQPPGAPAPHDPSNSGGMVVGDLQPFRRA